MPQVAITGATGFIGAVIAAALLKRGWQVRALARSDAGAKALQAAGVEVVRGALDDPQALARLTADSHALVHCAGAVRGARYADFAAVNLAGTQALLQALPSRDIPVVLLSSLAAREPQLSHYARSKRAMEALLESADAPRRWLALRPPPVYGPGDTELLPLFQCMARGLAPLPGADSARVSMLFVDDLAQAVLTWLHNPEAGQGVYELHDGQPNGYSWAEIIGIAEHLLGRRVRRVTLPKLPFNALAHGNAALARVLGYAPMLTPGKLRELRHGNWVADNSAFSAATLWQPQVRLPQGLQLTCGW